MLDPNISGLFGGVSKRYYRFHGNDSNAWKRLPFALCLMLFDVYMSLFQLFACFIVVFLLCFQVPVAVSMETAGNASETAWQWPVADAQPIEMLIFKGI
jgi:hypothetical protein